MPRKKERHRILIMDLVGLSGLEGLNSAKVSQLHVELGVKNVHDLYQACLNKEVSQLDGWDIASEESLKSTIELGVLWVQSNINKTLKSKVVPAEKLAKVVVADKEMLKEIAEEQAKKFLK